MRIFLLVLVLLLLQLQVICQQQCTSTEYKMELLKRSPESAARMAAIESFTKNFLSKKKPSSDSTSILNHPSVITLPVVVHIIYNSASQNISDAQIQSQIAVLNMDYRRLNTDASKTPAIYLNAAADCGFQFVLANVDPQGNATNGIVRRFTNIHGFTINDAVKSGASGGDDAWDCNNYLNIWVCNLSTGILGYSSVPGGPKDKDGVVIQYTAFGTNGTAAAPFNKGRTATHEIGHWLNLIHTWGDADCGDDQVADTPPQKAANRGCPDAIRVTCEGSTGDMYMNFMDFTDDVCMNMFTKGQRERMQALFAPGGPRNALLSSTAVTSLPQPVITPGEETSALRVYPNPASGIVFLQVPEMAAAATTLDIYNEMGQKVMTVLLNQHLQQLNVSSLKSGLYYIKTNDGKSKSVTKLVKM